MKTIRYVGALATVVMDKMGRSEAGADEAHVKRGEPLEVTELAAERLVGEPGGWCWEEVAAADSVGAASATGVAV